VSSIPECPATDFLLDVRKSSYSEVKVKSLYSSKTEFFNIGLQRTTVLKQTTREAMK